MSSQQFLISPVPLFNKILVLHILVGKLFVFFFFSTISLWSCLLPLLSFSCSKPVSSKEDGNRSWENCSPNDCSLCELWLYVKGVKQVDYDYWKAWQIMVTSCLKLTMPLINAKVTSKGCLLDMHIQVAKLFQIPDVFRYGYGKKVLVWAL